MRVDRPVDRAWILAIVLAVVFAAVRVVGTMGPVSWRWVMPLGFVSMALLPLLLLNGRARREAGFQRPRGVLMIGVAMVLGAAAAFACYAIGTMLFGAGPDNWFVSIANSYRRTLDTTGWNAIRLHVFFTLPALLFSPIGEEIFFRGYLQYVLERRFGQGVSTVLECAAFAVIHLCHHGLFLTSAGLGFRPLSGAIWMLLMFGTAFLFAWLRKRTGSLVPAIASHAAFNLVMNLTIFGLLWPAIGQT